MLSVGVQWWWWWWWCWYCRWHGALPTSGLHDAAAVKVGMMLASQPVHDRPSINKTRLLAVTWHHT
jgi:hypothetical protein